MKHPSEKALGKEFFNRPTLVVAEELIGCYLVRRINDKIVRGIITETEAYDGPRDQRAMLQKAGLSAPKRSSAKPEYFMYISSTECIGC